MLFPIFLLMLWKIRKQWILGALVVITVISFGLSQWGAYYKPEATFYLLHTRAWELASGAIISYILVYKNNQIALLVHNKSTRDFWGIFGLTLIICSIFLFDKQTPFPSAYTLVPIFGASLIILFATSETVIGKLLSTKLLVGIGLISYSAYLWHHPLFAFARNKTLNKPSLSLLLILSALSLVLAYFSWRFIETPFRNRNKVTSKTIFILTATGSVLFATIGIAGNAYKGFQDAPIYQTFTRTETYSACFDKENVHNRDDWYCTVGNTKKEISFFLLGDSHSLSLVDEFNSIAISLDMAGGYTGLSGCVPFLGVHSLRNNQNTRNCNSLNKKVFEFVQNNKIRTLFLVARWTYYTDGGYDGKDFSFIGTTDNSDRTADTSRQAFKYGYNETVNKYKSIGVNVVVIEQAPQQLFMPNEIYGLALRHKDRFNEYISNMSIPYERHKQLQKHVTDVFNSSTYPQRINFDDILCKGKICSVGTAKESYYFDDDHLSTAGAKLVSDRIKQNFINIW